MESTELLNTVFSDFSLFVREYCFETSFSKQKTEFMGQLADKIHNLPTHDLSSDFGQKELRNYLNFLEDTVKNRRIENDTFLSNYKDQITTLKRLTKNSENAEERKA